MVTMSLALFQMYLFFLVFIKTTTRYYAEKIVSKNYFIRLIDLG